VSLLEMLKPFKSPAIVDRLVNLRFSEYVEYFRDHFQNLTTHLWSIIYLIPEYHENLLITFWVMLLTDRQTNKQVQIHNPCPKKQIHNKTDKRAHA